MHREIIKLTSLTADEVLLVYNFWTLLKELVSKCPSYDIVKSYDAWRLGSSSTGLRRKSAHLFFPYFLKSAFSRFFFSRWAKESERKLV